MKHLTRGQKPRDNLEITIVSDENFFLFSPLLHEVALGRIEPSHIAYPIRKLPNRDRFTFVLAGVEEINLDDRQVKTSSGTLDFDYLVLALGCVADTSVLSSPASEMRSIFTLRTLGDAIRLRSHLIDIFKQANQLKSPDQQSKLLTFVISGSGYIGVQLAAELRDYIFENLARFYPAIDRDNIRIILVEEDQHLLARSHPKFGPYALKHLQRRGIEIRLKSRITSWGADYVEINNSETVSAGTVIGVTGVAASSQITHLGIDTDSTGRVLVDEYLEVPAFPNVFALGDCAHFREPKTGQPIPHRAHTAVRQARIAAYNILADIRSQNKKPYQYSNPFDAVTLGNSRAVFRFDGLRFYGILARLTCLVGYSILVPGTHNRIRILIDWLLSVIFKRRHQTPEN